MDLRTAAADLLLGSACAGCGVPARRVCGACLATLAPNPATVAHLRAAPVVAALPYDGLVPQLLIAWKERDREALAPPLGRLLAAAVLAAEIARAEAPLDPRPAVLVPVPASAAARRARGHDHVVTLARAAARDLRALGVDVQVAPLLRVVRRVRDQSALGARARAENLRGAFGATRRAAGVDGPVIVVDDVLTTGSTLREAARAVRDSGLEVVAGAVVAARVRTSVQAGAFLRPIAGK